MDRSTSGMSRTTDLWSFTLYVRLRVLSYLSQFATVANL